MGPARGHLGALVPSWRPLGNRGAFLGPLEAILGLPWGIRLRIHVSVATRPDPTRPGPALPGRPAISTTAFLHGMPRRAREFPGGPGRARERLEAPESARKRPDGPGCGLTGPEAPRSAQKRRSETPIHMKYAPLLAQSPPSPPRDVAYGPAPQTRSLPGSQCRSSPLQSRRAVVKVIQLSLIIAVARRAGGRMSCGTTTRAT